jgi:hypothetical protein
MFGRKKKKQEQTGLAGLSSEPTVTVSPAPATPDAPATPQPPPAPGAPAAPQTNVQLVPGLTRIGPNPQAVLSQILSGHGAVGELVAQIKADPQGFRNRMIAQAQAAGVSTFVMTPQGMTPLASPGAGAPQHVDVVEELTKAADLHDKGALSDAEFEALKKKLLGE